MCNMWSVYAIQCVAPELILKAFQKYAMEIAELYDVIAYLGRGGLRAQSQRS